VYVLKPGIKQDPVRRWALPYRIFFGYGACHILAGVFLERYAELNWYALRITPEKGLSGSHVFVTDGRVAFDYHGYSGLKRLLRHHEDSWTRYFGEWQAEIARVDFSLLDTTQLNARNMRGPDQYYGNTIERTNNFLDRFDHDQLRLKTESLL